MTLNEIPIKPDNSYYTDEQWQAIYEKNKSILVSASAGSGKTTILVERVIEKIKNNISIQNLLIVTYTEAAAKEMKLRIEFALKELIEKEVNTEKKSFYIEQLNLLPMSQISTLHAFCLKVIQRFYYIISIDPVFQLMTDEVEQSIVQEEIWDNLREELYAQNDAVFERLVLNFSNDRTDNGFTELLFNLYYYARSKPNMNDWLKNLSKNYHVQELSQHKLYREVIYPYISHLLKDIVNIYKIIEDEALPHISSNKYYELYQDEQKFFTNLLDSYTSDLSNESLLDWICSITHWEFKRFPINKKEEEKEFHQLFKNYREVIKDIFQDINHIMNDSFFDIIQITKNSIPMIEKLSETCQLLDQAFFNWKIEHNQYDFNDLEHLTLGILTTSINGRYPAQDYYKEKFEELLIDEYQDINELQETILKSIARYDEHDHKPMNMFMVGDMKQSIYGFRLADPTLFLSKYYDFAKKDDPLQERILLKENFRSGKNIITFTNIIFEQLMDQHLGQIDYEKNEYLICGSAPHQLKFPNHPLELIICDNQNELSLEKLHISSEKNHQLENLIATANREYIYTAIKIKQMIQEQYLVYDKKIKGYRPVEYRDIVLLTQTKTEYQQLAEIFEFFDIPLYVTNKLNYFQSHEIQTILSLLKIIDNPYQDIPLVSVLRSPIVGLSEQDLLHIRNIDQVLLDLQEYDTTDTYYLNSIINYIHAFESQSISYPFQETIIKKLKDFLSHLNHWRDFSKTHNLSELIWNIYDITGYLDYVGGLLNGEQKQINLHALYERASLYEAKQFKGLYAFIQFIERLQKQKKDLAEPILINEQDNVVRVMTIHASKGLEFPIVFFMNLGKSFNLIDLNQNYVFDDHYGLGVKYLDLNQRLVIPTLPFLALQILKKEKLISEEYRKLYVAMTRAEQQLFLVSSWHPSKNEVLFPELYNLEQEGLLQKKSTAHKLPYYVRFTKMVPIYLLLAILKQKTQKQQEILSLNDYKELSELIKLQLIQPDYLIELIQNSLSICNIKEEPLPWSFEALTSLVNRSKEILNYKYPYNIATMTSSYQSVSELKRTFEDPDQLSLSYQNIDQGYFSIAKFTTDTLKEPEFVLKQSINKDPAAIGKATHLLLQLLPLNQGSITQQMLSDFVQTLVEKQFLPIELSKMLPLKHIVTFFQTDFGQELQKNHQYLHREKTFSMLIPAQELFKETTQLKDEILIHGIIDGYLEYEDHIVLFDYKTDYINPNYLAQEQQRILQKYQGQLYLYKKALEISEHKPVTRIELVLLSLGKSITLT